MSIRAHVRKLRPVNDISIPLVEKVQDFLTEGSLSPADVVGLTGVSSTFSVGSISPADVVGLSLNQMEAEQARLALNLLRLLVI